MRYFFVLPFFAVIFAPPISAQTETTDKKDIAEEAHSWLSESLLRGTTNADNFFNDERYSWENNKSRVTLRSNFDFIGDHGFEFKPQGKINLAMPGFGKRMRFITNETEDDENGVRESDENETNVALRYIALATRKYALSADLGISTRGSPAVQFFGRANLRRNFNLSETWKGRLEDRLYWYNDSKWRNDFRWYFERELSEKFLFRSRTRFDFMQDRNSNVFPQQSFILYQMINNRTAIAYEAIAEKVFAENSVYDSDEFLQSCGEKCDHFLLRLRFRQSIGYPWLFYEVWPTANWTEERDYEFSPSIRFRLEIVLGNLPKTTRLH